MRFRCLAVSRCIEVRVYGNNRTRESRNMYFSAILAAGDHPWNTDKNIISFFSIGGIKSGGLYWCLSANEKATLCVNS